MQQSFRSTPFSNTGELFFIAGPCVIESRSLCLDVAHRLARLASRCGVTMIFKASFDKANRTALKSFRGPGRQEGLRILEEVRSETGLAVLTDVHEVSEVGDVASVVDILQIPAFLCRQTDLLVRAGQTGRIVNIKKGQFMAPADMRYAVEKAGSRVWLTERGTFFGYNRLVVDFLGIHTMRTMAVPVVFDATHSVQLPGGGDGCSAGQREYALPLARAAICQGADGLFFEVHPDPSRALCDGANSVALDVFERAVPQLVELHKLLYDQHNQ